MLYPSLIFATEPDSENPNHAQSLYESVGFKRVRTQVSYKKRL